MLDFVKMRKNVQSSFFEIKMKKKIAEGISF